MKTEDLAYFAGIIDGEGSIYILQFRQSQPYYAGLAVYNTNRVLLEWVVEHFGGNITTKPAEKGRHKIVYLWRNGVIKDNLTILEQILPFLIVKKQQALLALEFLKLQVSRGKGRPRYSHDDINLLRSYYEQMSKLNKRGEEVESV